MEHTKSFLATYQKSLTGAFDITDCNPSYHILQHRKYDNCTESWASVPWRRKRRASSMA